MDQDTKLLIDLPSDILIQILGECDVFDILSFSSACKHLLQVADEHQVWLHQARRLHISIPPGTSPSKAELKGWVVSRAMVDVRWIRSRPGDLVLHSFEMFPDFVGAYLIPGGEFVVLVYDAAEISLTRIERSEVTGRLALPVVARCEKPDGVDCPGYWSSLLTETSYGRPVLVWVGDHSWRGSFIFLIDPVSQVIERKQRMHWDLSGVPDPCKILAMKDRMFLICEDLIGTKSVSVLAGPDPDQVMRRFNLDTPRNAGHNARFILVSENGLIANDYLGVHLYHIPESRGVGDDSDLVPVWSWRGDASQYYGTLYKTASPYPALWLQGESATHTLEFCMDESGFPVVANHHIIGGKPAYCVEGRFKQQGRKGMSVAAEEHSDIVLNTGVLGKPDITRELRAKSPGDYDGPWDEVKYMDLDEETGRIVIVIGDLLEAAPYARWLCLADLPT